MSCDDIDGQDTGSGRRLEREGIYVYIQLIHIVVKQKLTQHCKAIILQFLKNALN